MKVNKKLAKELKKLADTLPAMHYITTRKHLLSGSEIIEKGIEVKEGTVLNSDARYLANEKVRNGVNHYRRLRSAYQGGGMDAVKAYTENVFSVYNSYKNQKYAG